MSVDAAFVFPVPQSGNEDLGDAREKLFNMLMLNEGFSNLIMSRNLFTPFDLQGGKFPPTTKSFLIIHTDCRFLSPKSPRGEQATARWERLRNVMKTVVEASRLLSFTAPWYADDITNVEFTHDLVLAASNNRVHLVNAGFIDFMEKTFNSESKTLFGFTRK